MTPDETRELVGLVYALYNNELLLSDEKRVLNAWYQMLRDCEFIECKSTMLEVATHKKYMPKPGELRREVIDARTGVQEHLDAYSAWGTFVTLQRDSNFGTQTNIPRPEALQKTLEKLGSAAFEMHTNGDREVFVRVYNTVLEEMQRQKYKFS